VLVWLELAIFLAIYRTVFKGGSIAEATSQAPAEVPQWAARFIALEARFWLKLWNSIRRLFGKK
jgi:hypothetical protein